MARSIVLARHTTSLDKVVANVTYIGFRARENGEEKGFFNAKLDSGADFERYLDSVRKHPALQHSATVKAHTLILSLRQEDYNALREAGGNLKDLAREVVQDLEKRKNMSLEWIGALHEKSGHPHVHLNIRAVGETPDGPNKRLRLTENDCEWLRGRLDKHLSRYVPEQQQSQQREQEKKRESRRKTSKQKEVTRAGKTAMQSASGLAQDQSIKNNMAQSRKRRPRRHKTRNEQIRAAQNQRVSQQDDSR